MTSYNLQIRLPMPLAKLLERVATHSKAEFVRQAIQEKIVREQARAQEKQWIRALAKQPDHTSDEQAWLTAEAWEDR